MPTRRKTHISGWQAYELKADKRRKKRIKRGKKNRETRTTGACAVSFDKGPLECYQMEASERSVSHTYTHTLPSLSLCICLPLFLLVSFQSRNQPLADRTGPLGSCYRPPQWRDWKAQIAALQSSQSQESLRISHWIPFLRQREAREGGSGEKKGGRMKGRLHTWWELKEREIAMKRRLRGNDRDCQRGRAIQREIKWRRNVCVFVLLPTCCLPGETLADIRNGTWAFLKSKLIPSDGDESYPPTRGFYASCSDTKDFRCRQQCPFLQCSAVLSFLGSCHVGHYLLPVSACREIQSFRLQGRGSGGQIRKGRRTGQGNRVQRHVL